MKAYHSIEKWCPEYFGEHVFAFDKIDGSNFRVEWDRKLSKKTHFTLGFRKFGSRNEMIKNFSNPFAKGIEIFKDKYFELDRIFNENKRFRGIDRITIYGEFFGENSFAGIHDWKEDHDIIMFDVFLYKKGYLPPAEFIKIFDHLDIPKLVYQGTFCEQFVKDIETNKLGLKEGVVCKSINEKVVEMFKVKTNEWLNKIREKLGVQKMLEY